MSGTDPVPPVNPDAQNAINQLGEDRDQLNQDEQQVAADIALLQEFLSNLDAILQQYGPEVALMMMMSKGFYEIDQVKNDNYVIFADKINVDTDYQTMGTLAEGYLNEGASKDGISLSDTYSLYLLLQQIENGANDGAIDPNTGKLISGAATTIDTTLFFVQNKGSPTNDELVAAQNYINKLWSTTGTSLSPFIDTVDKALDEISTATNSSSQMLQTEASTATNSYKSFLDIFSKNFTNYDTLEGDINRKTSQAG